MTTATGGACTGDIFKKEVWVFYKLFCPNRHHRSPLRQKSKIFASSPHRGAFSAGASPCPTYSLCTMHYSLFFIHSSLSPPHPLPPSDKGGGKTGIKGRFCRRERKHSPTAPSLCLPAWHAHGMTGRMQASAPTNPPHCPSGGGT